MGSSSWIRAARHSATKPKSLRRRDTFRSFEEPRSRSQLNLFNGGGIPMSKETPKDDPRQKSDQGSHKQTDKPWKGTAQRRCRDWSRKMARNKHAL